MKLMKKKNIVDCDKDGKKKMRLRLYFNFFMKEFTSEAQVET